MTDEFIADKEVSDTLKLEASIATPRQDKLVREVAVNINNEIIHQYGSYIPQETIVKVGGVEERILITNTETFEQFHYEWDKITTDRSRLYYPEVTATVFTNGQVMAFEDPTKAWQRLSKETQVDAISRFGSEAEARGVVAFTAIADFLCHEVVHQYQDENLPKFFKELGAYFYQRQIATALHFSFLIFDLDEARIQYYNSLLNRFGEDVHKIFFGSLLDSKRRTEILSSVTKDDINELFPEGMGL